ncbi:MAG: pqiA2 [Pseudomonas sp.]|nr:pqiA2 [Pseudomonas sp.]
MCAAIAQTDRSQCSLAQRSLAQQPLNRLVACHECDWLMIKSPIVSGASARCPRCGFELYSHRPRMLRRGLALTLAALVLFIPANFLPLISLNLLGQRAQDSIWASVQALWHSGMPEIAVVVLLCGVLIPLLKLVCVWLVLLSIRFKHGRRMGLALYRLYLGFREWGMLEVYLMGALVSLVKLAGLAELELGVGAGCFAALVVVQVWLEVTLSPHQIWEALSGEDVDACH